MRIISNPQKLSIQRHNIGCDLHTHDTMVEMELLVEGSGTQVLNGRSYSIRSGWFWLSRPQDFHEVDVPKGADILNIQFKPSVLSRELLGMLLDYEGDVCLALPETVFSDFLGKMEVISEEYERDADFSTDVIKREIELMLLQVFRLLPIAPIRRDKHMQNSLIERAILFMRSNFSESPSLSDAAEFVHLNADYFAAQFKKHIGKTYYAYLTDLKMEQAKKLTLETELPLSAVAFRCGFGDQSNFLRQFKRYFGCTPTQMRAQKRNAEV